MRLDDSLSAVVTGGASGLGEATARALAEVGVRVTIFDVQQERGEKVAREIRGVFCSVDVTSDESVAEGFARARAADGQERILVNCAGAIGKAFKTASRDRKSGEFRFFSALEFDRVIQINLVGTFRCIARAAAGMLSLEPLAGERGAIVNTASIAAEDGQIGQAAYTASKAGIAGLTLVVARDLGQDGIRCNTIMPGLFDTPLLQAAPEQVKQALGGQVPFPSRLGNPVEYASLALEMIRNGYFNGECVRLDGAIRMPPR